MTKEVLQRFSHEFECRQATPTTIIAFFNEYRADHGGDFQIEFIVGHTYEELVGDGYMTQYMSFFEPDTDDDGFTPETIPEDVKQTKYFVFLVDNYNDENTITFELERL